MMEQTIMEILDKIINRSKILLILLLIPFYIHASVFNNAFFGSIQSDRFDTLSLVFETTGSKNVHIVRDNSAWQCTSPHSFSFWIKADFSAAANHYIADITGCWYLYYDGINDRFSARLFNSVGNRFINGAGTIITDNTWTHVIFDYDGVNEYRVTLNGGTPVVMDTGTFALDQDADNSLLLLERPGFPITNAIADEFAIFGKVLSTGEIATAYNGGKAKDLTVFGTDLKHWWREEGDYTVDLGTLNYPGVYQNAPSNTNDVP